MNKMMLSIFKGYADTMPVAVSLDEVVRLIRGKYSINSPFHSKNVMLLL